MIYLMRHGESTVNVARILKCYQLEGDLTEKGREQARLAGEWLKGRGITKIYASPFHRAQQSAEIVSAILELPFETDDDLSEINCGDLEGRTDQDAWDDWLVVATRWKHGEWDVGFPGGETLKMACDRLQRALQRGCAQTTLLVMHGGILGYAMPHLLNHTLDTSSGLQNTAIVTLEAADEGRYACSGWNLVDHLAIS